MATTILVADDDQRVRGLVKRILEETLGAPIVQEANDGEEALRLAWSQVPRVVVMDITMPRMDGLQATKKIKAEHPETKIIILTIHQDQAYREAAIESGADAFLDKRAMLTDLVPTVRDVLGQPPANRRS
jgi:DNA-binding NarL/FixJ family response regulator